MKYPINMSNKLEKLFAKYVSEKDFYPEYIKNSQNSNNPVRKWAEDINKLFTKENIQMTHNT